MIALDPPFRRAALEDAPALADLVNFAGEGMPLYLWGKMAEPGESAWDVGRRRAARDEGSFSWRNAYVADAGGRAVACLIGYHIADPPEPIPADMPAMFRPLQELENAAPGTWYVNVLAVYPEHRGRGLGGKLLGLADQLAAAEGKRGLSVIVADENLGARRLYGRCGYVESGRRPMVKDGWENPSREWVLLTKRLAD
ncbi:MAG: GNAT family N-acetyltransferase [Hyphomicrobiales bacterium]|nr:GNAT family N-acetyltransferase [Hyphomicrobiales bacterium]